MGRITVAPPPGAGGGGSVPVPAAQPTDLTVDTTTYDNTVTGTGKSAVAVFPSDLAEILAVAIEGDAFPRVLFTIADSVIFGSGDVLVAVGDGTADLLADPAARLALGASGGVSLTGSGVDIGTQQAYFTLPSNGTDPIQMGVSDTSQGIQLNGAVQISGDLTFVVGGIVVADQADGHTYRIITTNGVLSTQQVT